MCSSDRKPRVGLFLIGSRRFRTIGDGTARGNYRLRKEQAAGFMREDLSEDFEVVFPGVIYEAEEVDAAIKLFFCEKVDFVLAIFLSWTEDFGWIRFLRDMPPVPLLFAHLIRESVELGDTHDEDEFCEYLCCGGLVGSLEASGSFARWNRSMSESFAGGWEQLKARARVFGSAAMARSILRESRIGLLACYNEVMWSTYVDPYSVFMSAGPELNFLSVAELEEYIGAVGEERVTQVCRGVEENYRRLPGVEDEKFAASVRATLGMERLAAEKELDLLVLNDIDTVLFRRIGLRPGFYPTSSQVRTLIVPEGDLGAGLASYMLRILSGRRIHFVEPFHIDAVTDTFEGGHAGPNDYLESDGGFIAKYVRFAKTDYKYAGAPFLWHVFPAGLCTMLHVSQHNGRFIMTAAPVEALPCKPHLATYCHGRFRMIGQSCAEYFGRLMEIGVTQHFAVAAGDVTQKALQLGRLLGFETHDLSAK